VAVTTTLNVAAAKFNPNAGFTVKANILLARIIGPVPAAMVFQGIYGPGVASPPLPAQGIIPFGMINQTTFGGVATLIVNYVIKSFNIPYYNTYAAPFINALGVGLTVGGVIGGILDPPGDSGSTMTGGQPFLSYNPILGPAQPQTSLAQASASRPFLSVQQVRLHGR
jgi:hypothetical protein